jgi:hypothetical protein
LWNQFEEVIQPYEARQFFRHVHEIDSPSAAGSLALPFEQHADRRRVHILHLGEIDYFASTIKQGDTLLNNRCDIMDGYRSGDA